MSMTRKDEGENMKKEDEKIRDILKDIFTLANYYFVFQGVIFTAVFNNQTTLKCKYRWLPITLSLTAGTLNFMAFFQISKNYLKLLRRLDIRFHLFLLADTERSRRPGNVVAAEETSSRGAGTPQEEDQQNVPEVDLDPNTQTWRKVVFALCMLLFLGFIVVNVTACALILCEVNQCSH